MGGHVWSDPGLFDTLDSQLLIELRAAGPGGHYVSQNNPIRLFVSHTFEATPDYHRIFEYLESVASFYYVNYSDPAKVPSEGGKEAIKEEYRNQVTPVEAVIILSGLFSEHRDWITYLMDLAGALEKPIIAIEPFGGVQEIAAEVAERADAVVGWNDRNIVDAVRRQARHEETQRWEVIDFP